MANSVFAKDCLEGKLVLISGALGSLGESIVERLIVHGAAVVMSDVKPEESVDLSAFGGKASYYWCDVSDEDSVVTLFQRIETDFGRHADCVLCHAGVTQECRLEEYPLSDWERLHSINVNGSFLLCREAVKRMKGKHSFENPGKIIFTSSWVENVPWPHLSGYNSSKSAIQMLMKTAAREHARDHIRCNSVAPGIVAGGMSAVSYESDETYRKRADLAIPVGRLQPRESVSDSVVFLCSSASDYMTGHTLIVDGGNSLYPMI